jgi:alginate O-acetyltransferase complex protein AlgI
VIGYWPVNPEVLAATLAVLAAELLAGYALTAVRRASLARGAAWGLVAAASIAVERLTAAEPAGFRMLAIVGALLYGMKGVVCIEAQAAGESRLPFARYLAFALLWFGMRPGVFARESKSNRQDEDLSGELLRRGYTRLVLGMAFLAAAWIAWNSSLADRPVLRLTGDDRLAFSSRELAATALLLPGLSLILHFGVFNLLAAAWRRAGFDCRALFRAPLASRSLAEFWARRWNLGFTEMTSLAVFRPLRRRLGERGAALASFVFSGLVHELAISVPVRAGFGLPLLYFALHGMATMIERRLKLSGRSLAERPWLGRAWTMAWLVLPLPLLFHPPFLRGCFWPLIGA